MLEGAPECGEASPSLSLQERRLEGRVVGVRGRMTGQDAPGPHENDYKPSCPSAQLDQTGTFHPGTRTWQQIARARYPCIVGTLLFVQWQCGFCQNSVVSLCRAVCKFSETVRHGVMILLPSGAFTAPGDLVKMQSLAPWAWGRAWGL